MFGISTEKKVAREVDRIVSMKEDVDALSWGRVLEIGKLLRGPADDESRAEYARELVTIAQANLSLANRLGIDSTAPPGRVMPSGIGVVEGGYAEAALQETEPEAPASPVSETAASDEAGVPAPAGEDEAATADDRVSFALSPEPGAVVGEPACECEAAKEPVSQNGASHADGAPQPAPPVDPKPRIELPEIKLSDPADTGVLPRFSAETAVDPSAEVAPDASPAAPVPDAVEPAAAASAPADMADAATRHPADEREEVVACEGPTEAFAPIPTGEAARAEEQDVASHQAFDAKEPHRKLSKEHFSRFRNLYESQDGCLCVFEDEHGHLVAVDASKLA